jgi:hypothetical protein
MAFEVRFRGETESNLIAWRPKGAKEFGCSEFEARVRYAELRRAGLDGTPVDGHVPYVIEISQVTHREFFAGIGTARDAKLWQYAEPNAVQEGPWADNSDVDLTNELTALFAADDSDEPDNEHEPVSPPIAA